MPDNKSTKKKSGISGSSSTTKKKPISKKNTNYEKSNVNKAKKTVKSAKINPKIDKVSTSSTKKDTNQKTKVRKSDSRIKKDGLITDNLKANKVTNHTNKTDKALKKDSQNTKTNVKNLKEMDLKSSKSSDKEANQKQRKILFNKVGSFFSRLKIRFHLNHKIKKENTSLTKNSKHSSKKSTSIKKEKQSYKTSPLFTDKAKKMLMIVAMVCLVIILIEIFYVVVYQHKVEKNTIYYDSINSLAIDGSDLVSVGSSNFKYSKYYDYTNGLEKGKLVKYDKNGIILFEKMYDKGINNTFSSVITIDDGYIVVGSGVFSEQEQQDGAREAFILKYDKDGNLVWEKFYQVVTDTRFNKVIAVSDGYIVVGQSIYANMEMGNHTTGGGIIVKYDKDGNEVWHNNHGGMKSGNFNDVVEVDGNLYVVGKDATDSANIVKFNEDGKYEWHKNYSYTDGIGFTGIAYLDNALYVVGSKKILPEGTGDEDNRDTTNTDALLVKYDLKGKVLFEKNFGGSNYERYNSILAYHGNLYVVGHTSSKDAGFKIDTDGELMTGLVVRYDENGNILKKEILGGSNNDNLTDIITDGACLYISGYSNSGDGNIITAKNNGKDYFGKMIKLDFKFRTLMVK